MTTCTMTEYADRYEIEAEGHATGNQDVCSAVSMMLSSIANWVIANDSEAEQILELGYAKVVIPKDIRGADTIFSLAQLSFTQLEMTEKKFFKKVQILGKNRKRVC